MDAVNHNELLTPTQAARLKGVSRQWITSLIRAGTLEAVQIAGRNFVRQRDVLAYKPAPKTGRPPNVATATKATKKRGKK
jgi:excisionase family DNA binding protein